MFRVLGCNQSLFAPVGWFFIADVYERDERGGGVCDLEAWDANMFPDMFTPSTAQADDTYSSLTEQQATNCWVLKERNGVFRNH